MHHQTRTDFPRAHRWLQEFDQALSESGASELSVVYDMSSGCQYFWEADYDRASGHTDQVRAKYDTVHHAGIVEYTNHDPLCFALHWAGSFLDWIIGYPDRSLDKIEEALAIARRLDHPFNRAFALTAGATTLLYRGETERMIELCDEVETVVTEEGLGAFAQNVLVHQWRGKSRIRQGHFQDGYRLMKQGNDFWIESGGRICNALFWSWMAMGLNGMGKAGDALVLVERAIAHCRETGDRYMEPECLRLRGEFLLATETPDAWAAERAFREAIAIAQAHKAKSWELRAATSLAELWNDRGQSQEAETLLAPIYGWFTEGRQTADLRRAAGVLAAQEHGVSGPEPMTHTGAP